MNKPLEIVLQRRSTGMGAMTQYEVYSLRQKKRLCPAYMDSSRTGNHWKETYYLFPAKYLLVWMDVSNSRKHYCGAAIIRMSDIL